MLDRQSDAVQGDPIVGKCFAAAIFPVAKNWAADFRKLQTNLVLAAGVQAHLEQRSDALFAEGPLAEPGVLSAAAARGDGLHAHPFVIFGEPMR